MITPVMPGNVTPPLSSGHAASGGGRAAGQTAAIPATRASAGTAPPRPSNEVLLPY